MHEWLEALRKSAKATSEGVLAEEVRRAETECGVPFPADLADLYLSLNGGEFQGEVRLYPLRGDAGAPSVLEKSRLMVVGLPAAGVWRFGLKGAHRHLFVARKSAMEEQGDGGGPLPGWMSALDGDDWVFGTWDGEKREMRLYRTLKDMLEVLVPPVEEVESFGERTFARAMNAVLQGALSGAAADAGDDDEGGGGHASDLEALARDEDEESVEQEELFAETEVTRPAVKKARREKAAPAPVEAPAVAARPRGATVKKPSVTKSVSTGEPVTGAGAGKAAVKKSAAKGSVPAGGAATGTGASKATTKSALARGAAKKAPGKAAASTRGASAAKNAAAKKGAASTREASAAKKGAASTREASAAKNAAAKKGTVSKRGASAAKNAASTRGASAAKKGAASKRGASAAKNAAAKKGAASKRGAAAAKKGTAKKGAALKRGAATKSAARKPTAKKPSGRRS